MSENRTFDLTQTPPVEEPARQYYYMEKLRGLVADHRLIEGDDRDFRGGKVCVDCDEYDLE